MKWQHSDHSKKDYDGLRPNIRKAFDKQARLLAADLLHPSLRAKKYDESNDIWQARVNKAWRFISRLMTIPTLLPASSPTQNNPSLPCSSTTVDEVHMKLKHRRPSIHAES
jgi:hypothetical protein